MNLCLYGLQAFGLFGCVCVAACCISVGNVKLSEKAIPNLCSKSYENIKVSSEYESAD